MMENLVWKAYYHSMSGHEIRPFNIFEHGRFREEVRKLLLKCTEKEAFAEELRRSLFYYYCSKCEWEVVIGPWCGDRGTKEIKVDVYMQVMNNWDIFVDYVWNEGKKERSKDDECEHRYRADFPNRWLCKASKTESAQ